MKYNPSQRAMDYDSAVLAGAVPTIVYTVLRNPHRSFIRGDRQNLPQWMHENLTGPYSFRYDQQGSYFAFVRREDAMLFKLVWL